MWKEVCTLCGVQIPLALEKEYVVTLPQRLRVIYTVNAEFLYWAYVLPQFRDALNRGLCVVDGKWVQILILLKCGKKVSHMPGSRLIHDFLALADKKKLRVLLLGSTNEALAKAKEKINNRYPHVQIFTYEPGIVCYPFDEQVIRRIEVELYKVRPHILFVALGPPKQELLIDMLRPTLEKVGTLVAMGVGGSIDMIAGQKKIAPKWITDTGLEWMWRLFEGGREKKIIRSILGLLFGLICNT